MFSDDTTLVCYSASKTASETSTAGRTYGSKLLQRRDTIGTSRTAGLCLYCVRDEYISSGSHAVAATSNG